MPRILVLYYSRTGNTEKMAKAVAEGAKTVGNVQVDTSYFAEAEDLSAFDALIVGTPTYHHDMPIDIKMLFEEAAARNVRLNNKLGATFGSFGWSGEAPKLLTETLKNRFEMQVIEPPLIAKYAPDANALATCKELGKRVSETLMKTP